MRRDLQAAMLLAAISWVPGSGSSRRPHPQKSKKVVDKKKRAKRRQARASKKRNRR